MIDKSDIDTYINDHLDDFSSMKTSDFIHQCFTDLSDQWVSVSERLPKYDTPVWAELSDGKVVLMDFTSWEEGHGWAMIYDAPHYSHGEWWYESEYDDEYCVIKWKSLPEPPK